MDSLYNCSKKPWPNGLASQCKLMQLCKTRTCVYTYLMSCELQRQREGETDKIEKPAAKRRASGISPPCRYLVQILNLSMIGLISYSYPGAWPWTSDACKWGYNNMEVRLSTAEARGPSLHFGFSFCYVSLSVLQVLWNQSILYDYSNKCLIHLLKIDFLMSAHLFERGV